MRIGPSGPTDARIMAVGMGPERDEIREGKPFVGASGNIFTSSTNQLKYPRDLWYITNVTHDFLPAGTSLYSLDKLKLAQEVERLKGEILKVNPNVIVAMGMEPAHVLTGVSGMKWAGSILPCTLVPGKKVIVSCHPAWLIRGMWKWLTVFTHVYLKRAIEESHYPEIRYPTRNAIIGPSFNTAKQFLIHLRHDAKQVTFDIETVYWQKLKMGHIGCVGFGESPHEALCVPFIDTNGRPYWAFDEEVEIWKLITDLLQSSVPKIAQNASFEWLYFWTHRIYPSNLLYDTMTMHHCLYPDFGGTEDYSGTRKKTFDEPGHGLAFLNTQYTKTPFYKDDGKVTLGDVKNMQQWWRYNAMDVMVTADVAEHMKTELNENNLAEFYHKFYIKPFYHAVRAEWVGISFDVKLRDAALEQAVVRSEELQELINNATGSKLNVSSPKQLAKLLYKDKGYQVKKNRKTKKPTVDRHALDFFATKHQDEVLKWIIELRKLKDFVSDVLMQPLDEHNKTHTHFKLGGTDGARWSSTRSILGSGSNFQNIPRDGIARRLYLAGDSTEDVPARA